MVVGTPKKQAEKLVAYHKKDGKKEPVQRNKFYDEYENWRKKQAIKQKA